MNKRRSFLSQLGSELEVFYRTEIRPFLKRLWSLAEVALMAVAVYYLIILPHDTLF